LPKTLPIKPATLPDELVARGRYAIDAEAAAQLLGVPRDHVYSHLKRLVDDGRVFSPVRGLYVPIPPEHRARGAVPVDWFLDAAMRHLGRSYYLGFLSAAARHGAAHQAPQESQVVISKPIADRELGRYRIRFITSSSIDRMDVEQHSTRAGYVSVATRETTAVDLAWRPKDGAGLDNVATILKELGDLDGDRLARLAQVRGRAVARRLGWLLERFRPDVDCHWLRTVAASQLGEPSLLSPRAPRRGSVDRDWGLLINSRVQPDV